MQYVSLYVLSLINKSVERTVDGFLLCYIADEPPPYTPYPTETNPHHAGYNQPEDDPPRYDEPSCYTFDPRLIYGRDHSLNNFDGYAPNSYELQMVSIGYRIANDMRN